MSPLYICSVTTVVLPLCLCSDATVPLCYMLPLHTLEKKNKGYMFLFSVNGQIRNTVGFSDVPGVPLWVSISPEIFTASNCIPNMRSVTVVWLVIENIRIYLKAEGKKK